MKAQGQAIPALILLVGKGGVGRSTLAAALARVAVSRGRKVVVLEVAARQSVPILFGVEPRGYVPVECRPGLWAMRVTWEDALREYGIMKLRFSALYRVVFENPLMQRLLPALPGLADILVMGKIVHVCRNGVAGPGKPDCVILDAPATGHGLALLSAPSVVMETVPAGPLAEDAASLQAALVDPGFTGVHIVSTPEEMPVSEGIELFQALSGRIGVPMGPVLVNGVLRRGLDPAQRKALGTLAGSGRASEGVRACVRAALRMGEVWEAQRGHIERLKRHVPLPVVTLPDCPGPVEPRLATLQEHLDAMMWREGR
jgi:anion-transporting  ArsA/GET3 family ATPase